MPIGYWDGDQGCYIDSSSGSCTTLDQNGTGTWSGPTGGPSLQYFNGDLAEGWDASSNTWWSAGNSTNLNQYGNGQWNGNYWIDGQQNFVGYGWSANEGVFYSGGYATSLPQSGTGYYNGYFYVGGQQAYGLNQCGNGTWNGGYYIDGQPQDTGWSACEGMWYSAGTAYPTVNQYGNTTDPNSYPFWIDGSISGQGYGWSVNESIFYDYGSATTLDSSGSGFWNNIPWLNAANQPTGWNGYHWYIDNVETPLDQNGSGFYDGHAYLNGSQNPNGWNGYYWYIADQQTELSQAGDGVFNGTTYAGGLAVGDTFVGNGDWNDVGNWACSTGPTAGAVPASGDVTVSGSVGYASAGTPSMGTVTVTGSGSIGGGTAFQATLFKFYGVSTSNAALIGDADFHDSSSFIGGTLTGTAKFYGTSSLSMGATIGTAVFNDSSYMNAGTTAGTATFRGNSYNMNNVSTIYAQHGGGINGSNILGFA